MKRRPNRRAGFRSMGVVSLASVTLALLASYATDAQSPVAATPERHFEVASVKPNTKTIQDLAAASSGRGSALVTGVRSYPGGRWTATWVPVRTLLLTAFDLKEYQLDAGPKWLTTDRFDINATAGGDATEAEYHAMLRSLLIERFGLKTHMESRQMTVQVLTLARNDGRLGPALKPTSPECIATIAERQRTNTPPPPIGPPPPTSEEMRVVLKTTRCGATTLGRFAGEGISVASGGTPLSAIVDRVSAETKSPAVDRTGLTGLYDFLLEYAPRPRFRPCRRDWRIPSRIRHSRRRWSVSSA
jgi:uncharacterized protein (TIGR03435 family)